MIELTDEIQGLVNQIAEAYRTTLRNDGKVATGRLSNFSVDINQDERWFSIVFELEDYWKYVENGRAAGKFPPIDSIVQWIRVKSIVPKAYGQKVPSTKQLAFMIGRKIANDGIKPTKALQNTLDSELVSDLEDQLCDLILDQIESEVEDAINEEL